MILNKLKYKLELKRESFCNEIKDKITLTVIVQMAVRKKKNSSPLPPASLFKQLLFSLNWHLLVNMRANFWKAVNISLNMNYITC